MGKNKPALLGGLLIGVLSSLPVISAGNVCCCLWVVAGGLLTVYLQQQESPEPVSTGDAVVGGLIAGLVGGLITCVASYITLLVMAPAIQSSLSTVRDQLESNPDMPPAARDMVLRMMGIMTGGGGLVLRALITLPVYAVFGMLGALLGTAIFRKKPPITQA